MSLLDIEEEWHTPTLASVRRYGSEESVRGQLWGRVICPVQRLFTQHLQEDIEHGREKVIKAWLDPSDKRKQVIMRQDGDHYYALICAHLRCALEVIRCKGSTRSMLDDGLLKPIAQETELPLGLIRDIFYELGQGALRPNEHEVIAPFALVPSGSQKQQEPILAQFRMQRVSGGSGEVYVTPEQAFLRMSRGFDSVYREVPNVVRKFLETENEELGIQNRRHFDVRIRIERMDSNGELINVDLEGRSATGAAAWGLYFIFTGKVPDEGLITIAEFDMKGQLRGVDDVKKKMEAIARGHHPIDTVIVATAENEQAVIHSLTEKDSSRGIRVRRLDDPKSLIELVSTRSRLAEGLMMFLRELIDLPDRLIAPFIEPRLITELYIPQEVVKLEKGATAAKQRVRVSWKEEWASVRRGVILGQPGEGRTLLGRITVRWLAERSLTELEERRKDVTAVDIPVRVRLAVVSDKGLKPAVEEGVRRVMAQANPVQAGQQLKSAVLEHVLGVLYTDRCYLILDGLDEVPYPRQLASCLKPLDTAGCRVLVTTRSYHSKMQLPFSVEAEYDIAPFTSAQRIAFLSKWFRHTSSRRQSIQRLVDKSPHFDNITRNPLLLTLTCAAAERNERLPDAGRRVELYRLLVRDLLQRGMGGVDDPRLSLMTFILQRVAWTLFRQDPTRTLIPCAVLTYAVIDAVEKLHLSWHTDWILAKLRRTGLLVSVAFQWWVFMERSFMDYLAAEHVARQPFEDPLSMIEPFLWQLDPGKNGGLRWEPAAEEMLCFLAGTLDDPNPLLRRLLQLDEKTPDFFHTMLSVADHALEDAGDSRVDRVLAQRIREKELEQLRRQASRGFVRHRIHRLPFWNPPLDD